MAAEEHKHAEAHAEGHGGHNGGHGGHHKGGGHGGGHEEGHEGAPEWLISFADNVTLMMGFFVIMLAFSLGAKGGGEGSGGPGAQESTPNLLDLAISIRDAFNNPVRADSDDPNEELLVRRLLQRQGLHQVNAEGVPGKSHKLQSLRPSDYEGVAAAIPFEAHSDKLTVEGKELVRAIGDRIRGLKLLIHIRAHCSLAEAAASNDRGMTLCFDRAYRVALALQEHGLEWNQMRLQLCGAAERVEERAYTPSAHARNQRVEITIDDKVAPRDDALNGMGPPDTEPVPEK